MNGIPVKSDAQFDILRATHTFLLRVQSGTAGVWEPVSPRMQERAVDVTFELERILKGTAEDHPGDSIELTVRQTGVIGPRFFAVPGIWSNKELDEGNRFVAFCTSNAKRAEQILEEPNCRRIEAAEIALPDVELALKAGIADLSLVDSLARVFDRRAKYGYLFSQYIVDRLPEVLFGSLEGFDRVMALVEDSDLALRARDILLSGIYSRFLLLDPVGRTFVARLLVGTCRVVALPHAAPLHDNLLQNYLPNLLGLEGGGTRKSAGETFAGQPEQRKFCETILGGYPNKTAARAVLSWIRT